MKITDIQVIPFRTHADRFRNGQPLPRSELVQTLIRIVTDEGAEGYYLGGGAPGDQEGLLPDDRAVLLGRIRSLLVGHDPLDREMIWKWLWVANVSENLVSVVDLTLWDLAGRVTGTGPFKWDGTDPDLKTSMTSTMKRLGATSAALRLFKVASGINGRLPTAWVPSKYSVAPLSSLRDALGKVTVFCLWQGCARASRPLPTAKAYRPGLPGSRRRPGSRPDAATAAATPRTASRSPPPARATRRGSPSRGASPAGPGSRRSRRTAGRAGR